MLYGDASMGVAVDTEAFDQADRERVGLGEVVPAAEADGDDFCGHHSLGD
jgi:hypothetical protein